MGQPSIYYNSAPLSIADAYTFKLIYTISAAPQMVPVPSNSATMYGGVGGASLITNNSAGQTSINAFLGTTNEFLVASVSGQSTSAGSIIVNMSGQCKAIAGARVATFDANGKLMVVGTGGPPLTGVVINDFYLVPVTALTTFGGAVPTVNQIAMGDFGNIALAYALPTAFATAAYTLMVEVYFYPK